MRGAIPPLPLYVFIACCLVKHRDNFTFTFYLLLWMEASVFTKYSCGFVQSLRKDLVESWENDTVKTPKGAYKVCTNQRSNVSQNVASCPWGGGGGYKIVILSRRPTIPRFFAVSLSPSRQIVGKILKYAMTNSFVILSNSFTRPIETTYIANVVGTASLNKPRIN
jgi:hypothetical protein